MKRSRTLAQNTHHQLPKCQIIKKDSTQTLPHLLNWASRRQSIVALIQTVSRWQLMMSRDSLKIHKAGGKPADKTVWMSYLKGDTTRYVRFVSSIVQQPTSCCRQRTSLEERGMERWPIKMFNFKRGWEISKFFRCIIESNISSVRNRRSWRGSTRYNTKQNR